MHKSTITLTALALAALGVPNQEGRRPLPYEDERPPLRLKEERMTLEYTATADEAVILVEAESEESLGRIEMRSPRGAPLLKMATNHARGFALQGFMVETKELSGEEFFKTYEAGIYDLRAMTTDGRQALGSAVLSHHLPRPAIITYPVDGSLAPTDMTVTWMPDPDAAGYQVVLEQGESDGLIARLPADSNSFQVPPGILLPGVESHVEVGIVGDNGNCTLVEVQFTTY